MVPGFGVFLVPKQRNHWQEVLKICTNWEFWGLNNKTSTYCHCPLLLATGSCALALGWDTKPGHHALVRTDSRRQNLIFFINHNILHTLKKEPLNIMHLHTGRTMDGPWIKTVPIVYHIFWRIIFHGAWNRGLSDLLERWIKKPHPRNWSSKYAPTKSFGAK